MNRVLVVLTLDMNALPNDFPEILKKEQEVVAGWKEAGIMDHLFLRQERNGALLVFKDCTEEKVKTLIESLPFFPISKCIEYFNLIKQF